MRWIAAAAAVLACGLATPGLAQPAQEQLTLDELRRARSLSHEIMSPYCPGRTLADCPSVEAEPVKQRIREWIAAGVPDSEIRVRLGQVFGDVIEGGPRSTFKAVLPWLLIAAGGVGLGFALRRLRAPASEPTPVVAETDALLEDLERDLRD